MGRIEERDKGAIGGSLVCTELCQGRQVAVGRCDKLRAWADIAVTLEVIVCRQVGFVSGDLFIVSEKWFLVGKLRIPT